MVVLDEDALDEEVIEHIRDAIGEPPYTIRLVEKVKGRIDGYILTGTEPVVIPPHITDLIAFFNMTTTELDDYTNSNKPMPSGVTSLPPECIIPYKNVAKH